MKRIADFIFVVACVVLVAVVARNQLAQAGERPGAREGVVTQGTAFSGLENGNAPTLVLYLSPSCSFCQESMPFYRRLASRVRDAKITRMAFPMGGESAAFRAYLSSNGLDPDAAAPLPIVPGVRGTPTILLVSGGIVEQSWVGVLTRDQEDELLSLVR